MSATRNSRLTTRATLALPRWCDAIAADPSRRFETDRDKMRFVIELSRRNMEERTGGPFGAAVFASETGTLVSIGLNVVVPEQCSLAHAEVMALLLAQKRLGTFDLGGADSGPYELVSSSQPCIQCFGAIWWSGIARLVIGARTEQVESITGFDEGPLFRDGRAEFKGTDVVRDVLSDEACSVLREYAERGGTIYNPS